MDKPIKIGKHLKAVKISNEEFDKMIEKEKKIVFLDITKDSNNRDVKILNKKELKEKLSKIGNKNE